MGLKKKGNLEGGGVSDFGISEGHERVKHVGNSEGKGMLKCSCRTWLGMDNFWNQPMLVEFRDLTVATF